MRPHPGGDANPGLVVSVDPLIVAVATDLTKGEGSYPTVKIIEAPLGRMGGNRPEIGSRLGTVSIYRLSMDNVPHWESFEPVPAQFATGDPAALAELMQTFSDLEWTRLQEYLKRIPTPYQPGLYMIDEEERSER